MLILNMRFTAASSASEDGLLHYLLVNWDVSPGVTNPTDPSIDWPESARSREVYRSAFAIFKKNPGKTLGFLGFFADGRDWEAR